MEEKHLEKLLKASIIKPSTSDWASPTALIQKSDGTIRHCLDYRKLNQCTVKDTYPLPLIEDYVDTLVGTVFFSTLDVANGYYQGELDKVSQAKTAFRTRWVI